MESYFDWLCDVIGVGQDPQVTFYDLARVLHERIFYAVIQMDENRAWDGRGLRAEFAEGNNDIYRAMNEPCSVLEMLVGLARRMDFLMKDETEEDRTRVFFWSMVDNLGLMDYDDYTCHDSASIRAIDRILDRFLERNYAPDGRGGLFPLRNPAADQRDIQIWYQMNAWLVENDDLTFGGDED